MQIRQVEIRHFRGIESLTWRPPGKFACLIGPGDSSKTTILDANGNIYRQVYGELFEATTLVEPLKELVFNRHGSSSALDQWIDGIKLWCTVYDPSTNRYYFDYSIFYGIIISLLCIAAITVFVVRAWRENGVNNKADKV